MKTALFSFFKHNFFFLIAFLSLSSWTLRADSIPRPLDAYVDKVMGDELSEAILGLLAVGPEGDTLIAVNQNTLLIPASNIKLITTGLALNTLGRDFSYETGLYYRGEIRDSILLGDLYIVGGGDPTLAADDSIAVRQNELFSLWAGMVKDAGIQRIEGYVVGDGRYFDLAMPEDQTWQWDDCGTYYGSGVSGLNFYENIQTFKVSAGAEVGSEVNISVDFPDCPWMEYSFEGLTGEAGTGDKLYYYTSDVSPRGIVRGSFAVDRAPKIIECSNKFPALTCAAYFVDYLANMGIECGKGPADGRYFLPETGLAAVPESDSAGKLGSTFSPTLGRIVSQTNRESNNVYAETLFHTLGKIVCGSADYVPSRRAVEALLSKLGISASKIKIQDGSGLSRHNMLSPAFICSFLNAMRQSPEFECFVSGLPFPGDEGTLKSSMPGADPSLRQRIRLKSGSMTGVKCFSGYIFPEDGGDPAVFSLMINNSLLPQSRLQKISDQIILLISNSL